MMAYRLVEYPSPNHDARDAAVDMLVLHYTGMKTADEALARELGVARTELSTAAR